MYTYPVLWIWTDFARILLLMSIRIWSRTVSECFRIRPKFFKLSYNQSFKRCKKFFFQTLVIFLTLYVITDEICFLKHESSFCIRIFLDTEPDGSKLFGSVSSKMVRILFLDLDPQHCLYLYVNRLYWNPNISPVLMTLGNFGRLGGVLSRAETHFPVLLLMLLLLRLLLLLFLLMRVTFLLS